MMCGSLCAWCCCADSLQTFGLVLSDEVIKVNKTLHIALHLLLEPGLYSVNRIHVVWLMVTFSGTRYIHIINFILYNS